MSQDAGIIRITRATRIEATPQPIVVSRKSADLALTQRSAGAKPGTRGPHTNLFQGGMPAKKSAPAPELTVAQRVTAFAATRKLTKPQVAILGVVASHVLTYGAALTDDGFVVAKTAGVDYETEFKSARDKLLNAGILRMRSVGAIGIDGFDLGAGVNL
ncbi:hypothetical protein [Methylobacterium sp. Leaf112]|uniref:hypothetical protein n=1 Tax=Methylobacterium sp. Leaf112 TaxID=1736258 RepID=UPI0006FF64F4|nr:hypothetical protein [Methylobacterium sp. Leaf112]KQP60535.1 hypothetical protein ASF52_09505 [Methylobacterium sp. Leaf112]